MRVYTGIYVRHMVTSMEHAVMGSAIHGVDSLLWVHVRHMVTSMEHAVTTGSVIHGVDSLLWGGFRIGVCDRCMI